MRRQKQADQVAEVMKEDSTLLQNKQAETKDDESEESDDSSSGSSSSSASSSSDSESDGSSESSESSSNESDSTSSDSSDSTDDGSEESDDDSEPNENFNKFTSRKKRTNGTKSTPFGRRMQLRNRKRRILGARRSSQPTTSPSSISSESDQSSSLRTPLKIQVEGEKKTKTGSRKSNYGVSRSKGIPPMGSLQRIRESITPRKSPAMTTNEDVRQGEVRLATIDYTSRNCFDDDDDDSKLDRRFSRYEPQIGSNAIFLNQAEHHAPTHIQTKLSDKRLNLVDDSLPKRSRFMTRPLEQDDSLMTGPEAMPSRRAIRIVPTSSDIEVIPSTELSEISPQPSSKIQVTLSSADSIFEEVETAISDASERQGHSLDVTASDIEGSNGISLPHMRGREDVCASRIIRAPVATQKGIHTDSRIEPSWRDILRPSGNDHVVATQSTATEREESILAATPRAPIMMGLRQSEPRDSDKQAQISASSGQLADNQSSQGDICSRFQRRKSEDDIATDNVDIQAMLSQQVAPKRRMISSSPLNELEQQDNMRAADSSREAVPLKKNENPFVIEGMSFLESDEDTLLGASQVSGPQVRSKRRNSQPSEVAGAINPLRRNWFRAFTPTRTRSASAPRQIQRTETTRVPVKTSSSNRDPDDKYSKHMPKARTLPLPTPAIDNSGGKNVSQMQASMEERELKKSDGSFLTPQSEMSPPTSNGEIINGMGYGFFGNTVVTKIELRDSATEKSTSEKTQGTQHDHVEIEMIKTKGVKKKKRLGPFGFSFFKKKAHNEGQVKVSVKPPRVRKQSENEKVPPSSLRQPDVNLPNNATVQGESINEVSVRKPATPTRSDLPVSKDESLAKFPVNSSSLNIQRQSAKVNYDNSEQLPLAQETSPVQRLKPVPPAGDTQLATSVGEMVSTWFGRDASACGISLPFFNSTSNGIEVVPVSRNTTDESQMLRVLGVSPQARDDRSTADSLHVTLTKPLSPKQETAGLENRQDDEATMGVQTTIFDVIAHSGSAGEREPPEIFAREVSEVSRASYIHRKFPNLKKKRREKTKRLQRNRADLNQREAVGRKKRSTGVLSGIGDKRNTQRDSRPAQSSVSTYSLPPLDMDYTYDASTLTSTPSNLPATKGATKEMRRKQSDSFAISSTETDSMGRAWAEIADASLVVEKAINKIERLKSDEENNSQKIHNIISLKSQDEGNVEEALLVLRKHAERLGVRESDLLLAVKSEDTPSVEEASIRSMTFTEEIMEAFNMYLKPSMKAKKRK